MTPSCARANNMLKYTPAAQLERTGDLAEDMEVPRARMRNLNPGGSTPYALMPHRFAAVEAGDHRAQPYPASPFAEACWRGCAGADHAGTGEGRTRSRCADAVEGARERDGVEGGLGGCRTMMSPACWDAPGRSDPPVSTTVGVMCGGLVGVYDLAAGTIAVRFCEDGRVRTSAFQRITILLFGQ